jgi:hypothetical protein
MLSEKYRYTSQKNEELKKSFGSEKVNNKITHITFTQNLLFIVNHDDILTKKSHNLICQKRKIVEVTIRKILRLNKETKVHKTRPVKKEILVRTKQFLLLFGF